MTELPGVAIRKFSSGPFRGMVVTDSMLDHFLGDNGDPDTLFHDSASILKVSRSTRSALAKFHCCGGGSEPYRLYVKEFRYKNVAHSLKPLFGKHRAQIMWKVSWHLLGRGIAVPQPQGYILKRRGPFFTKGFFFSEVQSGCITLDELCTKLDRLIERFDSQGLLEALASQLARMHDNSATHGDLKWSNVLVKKEGNDLWFVDLDASRLYVQAPGPKDVARDLARFVLSGLEAGVDGTTLAEFLHHYARHRNLMLNDIEGPMMKVLDKLRRRHKRKLQSMPGK